MLTLLPKDIVTELYNFLKFEDLLNAVKLCKKSDIRKYIENRVYLDFFMNCRSEDEEINDRIRGFLEVNDEAFQYVNTALKNRNVDSLEIYEMFTISTNKENNPGEHCREFSYDDRYFYQYNINEMLGNYISKCRSFELFYRYIDFCNEKEELKDLTLYDFYYGDNSEFRVADDFMEKLLRYALANENIIFICRILLDIPKGKYKYIISILNEYATEEQLDEIFDVFGSYVDN